MKPKIIPIISANENTNMCAACGGECCTRLPGELMPADVDPELDPYTLLVNAHNLLTSGLFAIDCWDGFGDNFEPGYYMRPATVWGETWVDRSWGGACVLHHNDGGCELTTADRPHGCRVLVPSHPAPCGYAGDYKGKRSAAEAWWPFREVLQLLVENDPT